MNHKVTCNKCNRVSFSVSLSYVIDWERDWITHWKGLNKLGRENYGVSKRPPKIEDEYLSCMQCNNSYKNFRDAVDGDCPNVCTISGILDRNEDFDRKAIDKKRKKL